MPLRPTASLSDTVLRITLSDSPKVAIPPPATEYHTCAGQPFVLDGTRSHDDDAVCGDVIRTFTWTQTGGPTVVMSGADTSRPCTRRSIGSPSTGRPMIDWR